MATFIRPHARNGLMDNTTPRVLDTRLRCDGCSTFNAGNPQPLPGDPHPSEGRRVWDPLYSGTGDALCGECGAPC